MWFDIMNSSSKNGHKPSAAGFVASPYQLSILTRIINMFQNATVKGKTFPFQTGIVISSKSVMKLYADMKDIYSVSFLLTRRVNQDSLERFFGILRQMRSAFDHPEPTNFKYRMRQFVLSKKHVLVSVNPNTMSFKKDSFMVEGIKEFKKFSSPVKKGVTGQLKVNDDCEGDVADDWILCLMSVCLMNLIMSLRNLNSQRMKVTALIMYLAMLLTNLKTNTHTFPLWRRKMNGLPVKTGEDCMKWIKISREASLNWRIYSEKGTFILFKRNVMLF